MWAAFAVGPPKRGGKQGRRGLLGPNGGRPAVSSAMLSRRAVTAFRSTRWQCVVLQKSKPSFACRPRRRMAYVRAATDIALRASSDRNTLLSPARTAATYLSSGIVTTLSPSGLVSLTLTFSAHAGPQTSESSNKLGQAILPAVGLPAGFGEFT